MYQKGIELIVIEGPDGSGKSTLIDVLQKRYPDLELQPRPYDSVDGPHDSRDKYVERDIIELPKPLALYDRHPLISEPIYGPLIRGQMHPKFTMGWYWLKWGSFISYNPLIVVCLPGLRTTISNVKANADGQMEGVTKQIKAIYQQYMVFYIHLKGLDKVTAYDYSYPDPYSDEGLFYLIEDYLDV